MEFRTYLIRRLLLLIPVLIGVTFLIFMLLQFFSPAQRAMLYIHSPQQMRNLGLIIAKYGLNQPIWKQYWTWLVQIFGVPVPLLLSGSRPLPRYLIIGLTLGSISGYFGGAIDEIIMRITDIFMAFPSLILAMAVTIALGPVLKR